MWKRNLMRNLGIGCLALSLSGGICIDSSLKQADSTTNLESRITSSDRDQARYLTSLLDNEINDFSEFEILNNLVPVESVFLSLAFLSYGLTNIALTDKQEVEKAAKYIDIAIKKSMLPKITYGFFSFGHPLEDDMHQNVLYLGHLNLMMGAYTLISGDNKYHNLQEKITASLTRDFMNSQTHHLETYPRRLWPADNVVALASISLYDHIYKENHRTPIDSWLEWTKRHLDQNGLMYSHINPKSNLPDSEARGCAIAFSIPFIHMFDPDFAKEQYSNFRSAFFEEKFGIPFAREYLRDDYQSDVDSGPIIFGLGTVASAFSIAAAKVNGDEITFDRLSAAAEIVGLPYNTAKGKGYLANVSLGEAVLLYGRTWRSWF